MNWGELVRVEHVEAGRFDHPDGHVVEVLGERHVGVPCAAVRTALRGPAGLDVEAAGPAGHHQLAVDQDVERGGRLAFGEQRSRRERLDTAVGAQDAELGLREVFEQEKGAQLVGQALLAHRGPCSAVLIEVNGLRSGWIVLRHRLSDVLAKWGQQ
jgi:hypothetical protein